MTARDDAVVAAMAWLREWGLCPHDTGLHVVCPQCAASLATVIERVAESRARRGPSTATAAPDGTATEYDALRAECDSLVDRLHHGIEVHADLWVDDDDGAEALDSLRGLRVALLRLAFDHLGDPEAEETLAREGHSV